MVFAAAFTGGGTKVNFHLWFLIFSATFRLFSADIMSGSLPKFGTG